MSEQELLQNIVEFASDFPSCLVQLDALQCSRLRIPQKYAGLLWVVAERAMGQLCIDDPLRVIMSLRDEA